MFWKRKSLKPIYDKPTLLEKLIIKKATSGLSNIDREKLLKQIEFIKKILRIEYSNDKVIEFYPEHLSLVPREYYFTRTEEFLLATVKFNLKEQQYIASLHMSLGYFLIL